MRKYQNNPDTIERNNLKQHPYHKQLRQHARQHTFTAGLTGAVLGTVFLGPVGGILIGGTSAVIVKRSTKRKRNRLLEEHLRARRQQQEVGHPPASVHATLVGTTNDFPAAVASAPAEAALPVAKPVAFEYSERPALPVAKVIVESDNSERHIT